MLYRSVENMSFPLGLDFQVYHFSFNLVIYPFRHRLCFTICIALSIGVGSLSLCEVLLIRLQILLTNYLSFDSLTYFP